MSEPKPDQIQIAPETALNNLFGASRMAPLTADQHELLRVSRDVLAAVIEASKAPAKT
jgi:hypothetical protein